MRGRASSFFYTTIAARTCVGQHGHTSVNTYMRRTTRITHTRVKLCVSQYLTRVGQCSTPTRHWHLWLHWTMLFSQIINKVSMYRCSCHFWCSCLCLCIIIYNHNYCGNGNDNITTFSINLWSTATTLHKKIKITMCWSIYTK